MVDEEKLLERRIKIQDKRLTIYGKMRDRIDEKIQKETVKKQSFESQKSAVIAEKVRVANEVKE